MSGGEHAVVGPYRIVKAIGAGGSARIDLARIDRAYGFQRHVVIKRPLEHLRADPSVAASLQREAQLGGRLRHPNLVAVLDAGEHDGYDYLALEYIHGASLRTLMQPPGAVDTGAVRTLPLAVALSIVVEVARGLHEAHELAGPDGTSLGLVHRDVSPSNILLGADGTVKLADFGIAKDTRVSTLSGAMRGTVTYMAPEQCRGHAFDRRADVFSLGVILFELVTARRLFWADNDVASLHKVISGVIPDPRALVPDLAPELAALLVAAVAADPDARFATAAILADALEAHAVRAGLAIGARHVSRTVESVIGVGGAPWIELAPAPGPFGAPESEPSLVGLIESTIDEPEAEFAPMIAARPLVSDEPTQLATPHRHRRWIALGVIALAAASLVAVVALRSPEEGTGAAPTATVPQPARPSRPDGATANTATPTGPAHATTDRAGSAIEMDPGAPPPDPKQRPRRRPAKAPEEPAVATDVIPAAPIDAGVVPGPNDAPPARVEWKPTLLLPTDDPEPPAKRRTTP